MPRNIETIDLPEMICIGIAIATTDEAFAPAEAKAFETLFSADTGASAFLKISQPAMGDTRRALVGFMAAGRTEIPEGMERLVLPAARYLRLLEPGPLSSIGDGWQALHQHAAAMGSETTGMTVDFGYLPGLSDTPHELHLQLAPKPLLLG